MRLNLNHSYIVFGFLFIGIVIFAFKAQNQNDESLYYDYDELRNLYGSGDQSLWPEPVLDKSIDKSKFRDIGNLPSVEFPASNPYTKEKAELGKQLFFDKRLSKNGETACASCHAPEKAWADAKRKSIGHKNQEGSRNAMSILNTAHVSKLFWDGRAKSLEDQVRFPIEDPVEMNQSIELALDTIKRISEYQEKFTKVFGTTDIKETHIYKAIATFERTLVSKESKFDKFIAGNSELYTDQEVLGLHLYRTKANCISCHNTPLFSDNQFHNDGLTLFGSRHQDLGLFAMTNDSTDMGKFRTPSLREVNDSGPWMHNGNFPKLMDVIDYYNLGNPAPIQKSVLKSHHGKLPETSPILRDLNLSAKEKKALIAFLRTLSSDYER